MSRSPHRPATTVLQRRPSCALALLLTTLPFMGAACRSDPSPGLSGAGGSAGEEPDAQMAGGTGGAPTGGRDGAVTGGMPLPQVKAVLAKIRPVGANHHMVWESLTHAELGDVQ